MVEIVVLPPPLDGRLLDPVGLQTIKSRTRIGLSAFLPSAIIARPLNSLPFRCSVPLMVSRHRCCEILHAFVQRTDKSQEDGCNFTKRGVEVLTPLDSDPTSRALLEDFHVVYLADLANIVLDLLPRYTKRELRVAGQ